MLQSHARNQNVKEKVFIIFIVVCENKLIKIRAKENAAFSAVNEKETPCVSQCLNLLFDSETFLQKKITFFTDGKRFQFILSK